MTKTKKPQQRSSKLFAYFSNSSLVKEVLLIILLLLSFSSTIYALVTNPPAFLVLSRIKYENKCAKGTYNTKKIREIIHI